MQKWSKLVTASLLTLVIAAGCAKEETVKQQPADAEPPQEVEQTTEEPEQDGAEERFAHTFPLTGIGTDEEVNLRPVAVMINNHPKARPQSGLDKADLVYEVLAEGDITRFLAIYQSEQPEVVGPVRSARDYYIELSKGFDALYVAHGYSPEAQKMLNAGVVHNINGMQYDGILFYRAKFRSAPHNSYITFEKILKGAGPDYKNINMDTDVPSFAFVKDVEAAAVNGTSAQEISIDYSSHSYAKVEYRYNEAKQKYERYSGGQQTVDYETKTPVLTDNLFIVETSHKVIDSVGRKDINLTSGGKAYLIQQGSLQEVEWKNENGRIIPVKDGEPVPLMPGKTWVNVIPTSPGLNGMVHIK